jgi:hypothetical protein
MTNRVGPGPNVGLVGPGNNRIGMMGMRHDHDHDFGRHDRDHDFDHDRFRFRHRFFFPSFAVGIDTYTYPYDNEDCWVVQRVWTHHGLRLRRIWVCG